MGKHARNSAFPVLVHRAATRTRFSARTAAEQEISQPQFLEHGYSFADDARASRCGHILEILFRAAVWNIQLHR